MPAGLTKKGYINSKCEEYGCRKEWRYSIGDKFYCRDHYLKLKDDLAAIEQRNKEIKWAVDHGY